MKAEIRSQRGEVECEARHTAAAFGFEHGVTMEEIAKDDFDRLAGDEQFEVGPYIDTWGDGYGQPYYPWRQAFGKLRDGRGVYAETHPAMLLPASAVDIGAGI